MAWAQIWQKIPTLCGFMALFPSLNQEIFACFPVSPFVSPYFLHSPFSLSLFSFSFFLPCFLSFFFFVLFCFSLLAAFLSSNEKFKLLYLKGFFHQSFLFWGGVPVLICLPNPLLLSLFFFLSSVVFFIYNNKVFVVRQLKDKNVWWMWACTITVKKKKTNLCF